MTKMGGVCRFTPQGLVPHVQCWWCRVATRQSELLIAPRSSMLNVAAPVPHLIHRPDCHSPGERLHLQNTRRLVQSGSTFVSYPGLQD